MAIAMRLLALLKVALPNEQKLVGQLESMAYKIKSAVMKEYAYLADAFPLIGKFCYIHPV